jgi:hypothetical protein
MSRVAFVLVLLFSLTALCSAESPEGRRRQGYLFTGPGAFLSEGAATFQFGGGVEWFVYEGLAFGGEASLLTYAECFQCGGYVLGSINASYYLLKSSPSKLKPFVTAGYGGAGSTEGGGIGLVNFGGGVNYWFKDRVALRIEVRDHVDTDFDVHQVSLRVGITF